METKEYKVPLQNIALAQKKVIKLNRRAVKLGLPEMELIIGEPIVTEIPKKTMLGTKRVVVHHMVSIKGEYPVVNGWTLIAKIEHEGDVNMINIATEEDVTEWRERAPKCDHCGQHRISVKSYLIKNEESGVIMGVGSGCLKDFIPRSTENMVSAFQIIQTMMGSLEEYETGGFGITMYGAFEVLALANLCVRKSGWVPARSEGGTTADNVRYGLHMPSGLTKEERAAWIEYYNIEDQDNDAAADFIKRYKEIDPQGNNFTTLIQQIVTLEVTRMDYINQLTGAMAAHMSWTAKRLLKAKEDALAAKRKRVNDWVGTAKERREFKVIIEGRYKSENMWGTTTIYKMLTDEGYCLTWFSSNDAFSDIESGDEFKMVGTVKDHITYRDTKQTIVNRCKLVAA